MHNEIRARLLPIASQSNSSFDVQVSLDAATALISIDPFDEPATLALAECFARSGRRIAARDLLVRYAEQMRTELDEKPSANVVEATERISSRSQT